MKKNNDKKNYNGGFPPIKLVDDNKSDNEKTRLYSLNLKTIFNNDKIKENNISDISNNELCIIDDL
jgi:hypothetical protein